MNTFFITLFVLSIAIFFMSAGTMFFNLRLKGSCGGDKEVCICSLEEREKCLARITTP